ncbi:MAG: triose-phosphate isomerase family protein [Patescibacteria group bacterium]
MNKLVIANWKMNPSSLNEAQKLAKKIKNKGFKKTMVVLCPPALYITDLKRGFLKNKIFMGGQDFFLNQKGSWTGKISAEMLKKSGADFVMVGHSEVKALGESDEEINNKIKEALKQKLNVILCVGEKKRDEEGAFFLEIEKQIRLALKGISNNYAKKIVLVYEPVWAIGANSKSVISIEELQSVIIFIKKTLADKFGINNFSLIPVLYGGSVNVRNTEELLQGGVNGLLVGRNSLDTLKFNKILEIVDNF